MSVEIFISVLLLGKISLVLITMVLLLVLVCRNVQGCTQAQSKTTRTTEFYNFYISILPTKQEFIQSGTPHEGRTVPLWRKINLSFH